MISSSQIRIFSGFLILSGLLLTRQVLMLSAASVGLIVYLLISGHLAMLRRNLLAIAPIAAILFAVHYLSGYTSTVQSNPPAQTLLRLFGIMLTFSYIATFFLGDDSLDHFVQLGLRGEYLVIAISATSTLPLMQTTAAQIIDARFAAGLVKSRSFLSTATQLPYILRPLLTQALRLAIARSDTWHQRGMMERLERNLAPLRTQHRVHLAEVAAILLPAAWLSLIAGKELL